MCNFRLYASLGILLLVCAALAAPKRTAPLALLGKMPLPGVHGKIDHLASDIYRGRLFVAASADGSVQVLDIRHNSVLDPLSGFAEPHGVAYVKSSDRLFVSSAGDGTLRAYRGDTLKLIGSVRLGPDAGAIRVDTLRDRVYVGYGDGALAVLDSSGHRLSDIPLKAHPESFQYAETQPRIFVNLPDAHSIAVVDSESDNLIADWPLKEGFENIPMALDEAHKRIFVACRRPPRLLVVDMDSGLVRAHVPASGNADDLFYDPIHARLYALSGEGHITAYAQETADAYTAAGDIATVAGARTGLFVPEWNRLFLAVREFGGHPAEIRVYQPL
jgi:DNA-binding beta-propeller fold protein YncE